MDPKRAFAVAAHPDDIEIFMGGTLLHLKNAGYEIHYMNISTGSCGTMHHDVETIIRLRREESINAAALGGAVYHEALTNDIEIFYNAELLARLTSTMRVVNPEILLIHAPQDYMEDHMNAARLAVTAAFCRGMPNYTVEPHRDPVAGAVTIYHAQPHFNRDPLRRLVRPELFVNVADTMETKLAMLAEHKTQKVWLDESQGMDSYLVTTREFAQEIGKMSDGFEYAEGWRRHHHAGYCDYDADPLTDALGSLVEVNEAYRRNLDA